MHEFRSRIIFVVLLTLPLATPETNVAASIDAFAQRTERLDAWLQQQSDKLHLPGLAVATFEPGQPLHVTAIGNGVDTSSSFPIGSCTKSFTALAALIALQEAGISLDAAVNSVLPNLVFRTTETVTFRSLLQHRSGIGRAQGYGRLPTVRQVEQHEYTITPQSTPGNGFEYSNLNYAILGLIIEKLTGQPYCEFVTDRVFVPLGMTSSYCGQPPANLRPAAEYQYAFGYPLRVAPTVPHSSQIPSGFIHCSARDLAIFMRCIMNDGIHDGAQVFPRELIDEMRTPANDGALGYGMGLTTGVWATDRHVVGHEGATHTSYALAAFIPEDKRGLVLLTSINLFDPFTDQGESLFKNALGILDGQEPMPIRPYVIWLRWGILALSLLTCVRMLRFLGQWKRNGLPFLRPQNLKTWLELLLACLVPVAIWFCVLRFWAKVPLSLAFRSQPDIVGACLVLTVLGIIKGVIKICAKPVKTQTESTGDASRQLPIRDPS